MIKRVINYWKSTKYSLEWEIAYRPITDDGILSNEKTSFSILNLGKNVWAADPFLFEDNEELYLFYELYQKDKQKGVIAYSKLRNGIFDEPKIVINETYHLSFPCIFRINGDIFMIPETGSQKDIELYKSIKFPNIWNKEKILLSDCNSSDTICFDYNNEKYVFASLIEDGVGGVKNNLFKLDQSRLELKLISVQNNEIDFELRNGGNVFDFDGNIIRPSQNCKDNEYGKSLKLNIFNFKDGEIEEKTLKEVYSTEIIKCDLFDGIHTYNRTRNYEVVDLRKKVKNKFSFRCKSFMARITKYIKK